MSIQPAHNPHEPIRRTAPGTAAGVLDTIADGLTLVLSRPYLMIVPILLDLALWLGPRVTIAPLTDGLARSVRTANMEGSNEVIADLKLIGDNVFATDALGAFAPSIFTGLTLDRILNLFLVLISPADVSAITRADLGESIRNGLVGSIAETNAAVVTLVFLAALFVSSLLLVLFRVPIARAVRGEAKIPLLSEIVSSWGHTLLYFLILLAVGLASMLPLMLLTGLFLVLGYSILFVAAVALIIFGGLIGINTFFAVDAMLLHRVRPQRAFRAGYDVSRRYFGQISMFAIISVTVTIASLKLGSTLTSNLPGMIITILANALISTTLAASSMLFYSDRYRVVRAETRPATRTRSSQRD